MGQTNVRENLEERKLDFEKNDSGLHIIIDSNEVFCFPTAKSTTEKGFTLAYERFNENGVMVFPGSGADPNDRNLPEPTRSFLRNIIDGNLIEIYFKGKIPLKFHSWMDESYFKYWTLDL
ncbi:hypothetical protein HON86_03470 [Candidatus Woesearchaeota archaeon]|nr:hypothetical protein [Candidatus Woesearchaeota archaeon]MBT7169732.1 hypothetical protein [Candidatus Woesearchaeota archaeon]MBT7474661.1 hypothetical protein [Candidatus Woesearchaeota archaeon]